MEEEKSALEYFTAERLEKFSLAYKRAPSLWCPRYSNRKKCARAQFLTNLAKLLGEYRGKGVARRMAGLCRCFNSLLRHEVALAIAKAQIRAGPADTLAERARALLPAWAAHADGYLHVTADVLAAHGKTNEIPARIASSTSVVQSRAARARHAKAEARRAAAVERGGRGRAARVLRAVRRAALAAGSLMRVTDAAAAALREPFEEVNDIWTHLRLTALRKLRVLLRRGDEVLALPASGRLSALEWAAADLAVYFGHSVLHEDHFRQYHSLRALLATFHLVQRRGLEPSPGAAPPAPAAWRRAAAHYCRGRVAASGVLLQRRWHELKEAARRTLRAAWRGGGAAPPPPPPPLLQAVARRYPHVVTAELTQWARLVAGGHVAAPTIERGPAPGSDSEHSSSASDMSDGEDDLILVEKKIETIDLDGEDTDQQKDIPAAPRAIDMPSIDDREDSSTSNVFNAQADNEACEGNYKAMDTEKETTDVESNSEKDTIATLREMDVNAVEMTIQFDDDDEFDDSEINTEDSSKGKEMRYPNRNSSDTIEIESQNKKSILADKGTADLSRHVEVVNKCNPTVDTMENVNVVRVHDIRTQVESYIDKSVVSDITNQFSETNNSCIQSGLRSRTESSDSDSMNLVIDIEDNCNQTASLVEKRDSNLNADLDETSPAIGDKTKLNRAQSYLTESILTPKNNDNVRADRPENRVTSVMNKHNIASVNVGTCNIDEHKLNAQNDSHTIIGQTLRKDDLSNEKTPDIKTKINLLALVQSSKIDDSDVDNLKLKSDDVDALDLKPRIENENRSATDNIVGGHAIRNPILLQMLRSQSNDFKIIKRFESTNIRIRSVTGKTNKKALNKNVGDVVENNSNISDDLIDEDSSLEEDGDYGEIDPKLLMYPVVMLTRLDLARLPPLRQNRYITVFDPTLPPKFVFKKENVALLRLCRPCVVLLERIDLERGGDGGSRVAKRVELPDIEEVRRINKNILTAQVAPISMDVDKRPARRARSAKKAHDDMSPEELRTLLKNLAESEECPGRACVGCLGCAPRRLCAPAAGARVVAAQRRLLRLAARHKIQSGKPLDDVYKNRRKDLTGKEPPARVRSPYDPELAQREWIREKNLASEKFGIKPRSYKKKPVTETPSEPATITQLLGTTSATQSLEQTPPGSRLINSNDSLFSVSTAPEETIDLTITPSQYPPNVQVILNQNSTSTYLPLTEENLLQQAKNQPIFKLENNLFNPHTVADINKRLGGLADDAPPAAAGAFCPVIASVMSLAPAGAGHRDCPKVQMDNIISSMDVNQSNREATPETSRDASKTGLADNLIVSLKPSHKKIRGRANSNDKYVVKKLKRLVNQRTCGPKVLNQSEPPSSLLKNILKSDQAQSSPIAHTGPPQKESLLSTDPQATVVITDEVTRARRQLATLQAKGRKWLPLNPALLEPLSNTSARQPLLVNSVKAGAPQSDSMQHNQMNSQPSSFLISEQVEQKKRQVTYSHTNLLTGGALEVNAQSDPQSSSLMINRPNEVNLAVSQFNYLVNQHVTTAAASHQNISIPSSQAFGNNSITQQLWVSHHTKTLQVNSVQANSPQSNLLVGSTSDVPKSNPHLSMVSGQQLMPLNSVQAGPGNSLLVGSAQNSPLLVNMPQVTSFQPGVSHVTSLQGSFSQVTNFQAGSSQVTQINSFPTGHSQVTLPQTDPSQATSFLPSITFQAGSSQVTSFEAGYSLGSVSQTDSRTGSLETGPPQAISINVVPQTSVSSQARREALLRKEKPSYGSDFFNGRMVDTASLPAVPAVQYVRGRDRTALVVLTGAWPARRHLLLRAAAGDVRGPVFGLTPPCRLLIQGENEDGPTPSKLPKMAPEPDSTARSPDEDAAAKKPPFLRVRSFAKMGGDERPAPAQLRSDGGRLTAPARVFLDNEVYQWLCDEPLTYAKVMTVVASVRECRELVARRAPLTVFAVDDGRLHAVHAELTADGVLLSGPKEISEYLHELAIVLTPRPSPSPSNASRAKEIDNLENVKGRQIVKRVLEESQNSLLMERTVIDLDSDDD